MTITSESFNANKGILVMCWIVAIGIIGYWISYFTAGQVHASEDACYHVFQRNFPAPDGMIAIMLILCAEGLRRGGKAWALFTGMAGVGGLVFLALIDMSYNIWNDMYAAGSGAMTAETSINIICLVAGTTLWVYLWRHRRALIRD